MMRPLFIVAGVATAALSGLAYWRAMRPAEPDGNWRDVAVSAAYGIAITAGIVISCVLFALGV